MEFCVEAVEEARHGKPEIFNTDQGSQFTSTVFTSLLTQGQRMKDYAPIFRTVSPDSLVTALLARIMHAI
jgi:hypothetical protein